MVPWLLNFDKTTVDRISRFHIKHLNRDAFIIAGPFHHSRDALSVGTHCTRSICHRRS